MTNHICGGELERGQSSDSRKKSLRKGGIKVDGGHGCIERPCFVDQNNDKKIIRTFLQLWVALSQHSQLLLTLRGSFEL